MKQYQHILLDFDDTIYDTYGNASIALKETYDNFHLEQYFDCFETFKNYYWKRNHEVWALYSLGKMPREELIIERFLYPLRQVGCGTPQFALEMNEWFLIKTAEKGGLVEGARELLEYLRPKYHIHMLSNGFTEVQFKKLHNAGVEEYFETVVLSEMIGINKPDARIYEYALEKAGAQKHSAIMIGDNFDTDITGAMNAGIDQIFFNRKSDFQPENKPTYQVESLSAITQIL